ncbi:hypothetical protein TKK_0004017 [Trichogramma kaykai]|uniref:Odorant receptor n=1 Tax=Trichogramma kaykai TaxID=54128 RepID=A0ABD2XNL8_9HYME
MDKRLENFKPGRLFSMESNIYYNFHLLRLMCIDLYMKESLKLPVNIIILTTYLLTTLMTIVVLVKAIIKNETNINLIMEMSFTCKFTVDMMSYYIILLKYSKEETGNVMSVMSYTIGPVVIPSTLDALKFNHTLEKLLPLNFDKTFCIEEYFYLLLAIVIVINALMIVEWVLLLSANIMIIKYLEGLFDFMNYSVNHMYDNLNPIMIKMPIKTSNKEIRRNIINLIKCYQQILQVLIYPCQQLINANERFRNECYACKWYTFSPEVRKLLLGLTFRASHYFVLKAGSIISMTMETCSNILKTSLTYLVTVNQIYSSFGEK